MSDLKQALTFDASQALRSLNKLSAALDKGTKALTSFADATRNFNASAAANPFASYAKSIEKVNTAASSTAGSVEKASTAIGKTSTRIDAAHRSMNKLHFSTAKTGKGFSALAGVGKLLSGVLLGQLAFRAVSAVIQSFKQAFTAAVALGNALAEVQTIGQGMLGSYADLTAQVYNLSNAFGKSAQTTAEGLYQTLSNQVVEAGNAMKFLTVAQGLATVSASTTEEAVNALSSVMNVYGESAGSAYVISSKLAKTVELGRLRLGEMANSLGKLYPLAHELGISFEEVMASLATMTRLGTKANVSITQLRGVFLKLIKPSTELQAIFEKWGVESGAQAIQTFGGLQGVIKKLAKETGGSTTEMAKLFTRVRAISGILAINTKEGQLYAETLEAISTESNFLNEALEKMSASPARQLTLAWNEFKNTMADLAGEAIPLARELVKGFTSLVKVVKNVVDIFKEAWGNIQLIADGFKQWALDKIAAGWDAVKSSVAAVNDTWNAFIAAMSEFNIVKDMVAAMSNFKDTVKSAIDAVKGYFVAFGNYLMSFPVIKSFVTLVSGAFNTLVDSFKSAFSSVKGFISDFYGVFEPLLSWMADKLGYVVPPIKLLVEAVRWFGGETGEASKKLNGFNSELQQFVRSQEELKREQYWKEYWAAFKKETEASLKVVAAWSRAWDAAPASVENAVLEITSAISSIRDVVLRDADSMEEALKKAFEGPKDALKTLKDSMDKAKDAAKEFGRSLKLEKIKEKWKKDLKEAKYALLDLKEAIDITAKNPPTTEAYKKAASDMVTYYKKAIAKSNELMKEGKKSLASSIRSEATSAYKNFIAVGKNWESQITERQRAMDSVAGKLAAIDYQKFIDRAKKVNEDSAKTLKEISKMPAAQAKDALEQMIRTRKALAEDLREFRDKKYEILMSIDPDFVKAIEKEYKVQLATALYLEKDAGPALDRAVRKQVGDAYNMLVELEGDQAGKDFLALIKKLEKNGVITSTVDIAKDSLRKANKVFNDFQKKIGENKQLSETLSNEFGKIRVDWAKTLSDMENTPHPKLYIDYGQLDQLPAKGKERLDQLWALVHTAKARIDADLRTGEPIDLFDLDTLQKAIEYLIRGGDLTGKQSEKLQAMNKQATLLTNAQSNYNNTLENGTRLQKDQETNVKSIVSQTDSATKAQASLNQGVKNTTTSVGELNNTANKLPQRVRETESGFNRIASSNISQPVENFTKATDRSVKKVGTLNKSMRDVRTTDMTNPLQNLSAAADASLLKIATSIARIDTRITLLVNNSLARLMQSFANIDSTKMSEIGAASELTSKTLVSVVGSLDKIKMLLGTIVENFNSIGEFQPPNLGPFSESLVTIRDKIEVVEMAVDGLFKKIDLGPGHIEPLETAFHKVGTMINNVTQGPLKTLYNNLPLVGYAIEQLLKPIASVDKAIALWPRTIIRANPALNQVIRKLIELQRAAESAFSAVSKVSGGSTGHARYGKYFASGGLNRGVDTVDAKLSKGEFVVNADSSRKFFSELVAMNAGRSPSAYREEGGVVTNVGDINVNMSSEPSSKQMIREIASELRREIKRGTVKLC